MKTFNSSLFRPWGSLFHGALVMALVMAGWFAFLRVILTAHGSEWRQTSWQWIVEQPPFLGPAMLVVLIGGWVALYKFGANRGRYRAGARELEVRTGLVWRKTQYLRYVDIANIEVHEGPLMRLLGTADLIITASAAPHQVILYGVRAGEEMRRFLLERQESLRALASEERRSDR